MKPTTLTTGRLLLTLLVLTATIGLVSWDFKQSPGHYQQERTDTLPKNKAEKKVQDIDDAIEELNKAELKVNMQQLKTEMADAMKNLDAAKIKMEIDKALKEVNEEKIMKEVQESIAKIDFEKVKQEVANAMKEVDAAKLQQEIAASMAKVDWEKIKTGIKKASEIDMSRLEEKMKKVNDEMKDLGPKIEKEMLKAKVQIEKAKAEMKEFKEFTDELEKDGMISKKEGYTLKHKEGELFINGKKASAEVYSKYRSFLEKHKKFSIEKNDDDFNIDMD